MVAVNITWYIPSSNNAPITDYILEFCDTSPSGSCLDNVTVNGLTSVNSTHLSYFFEPPHPNITYEVFIRAGNIVGFQTAPVFGGGHRFRSAFEDDGRVVNVMIIPTTSVVILTWNLPQLALSNDVIVDFFEVTYFHKHMHDPIMSVRMDTVSYNPSSPEQPGFSANISSVGGHTFNITAVYSTPRLTSSPVTVTGVRTLEEGIIDFMHIHVT